MSLNERPLCDAHIHPKAAQMCGHPEFLLFVNSVDESDFSKFPSFSASRYYFAGIHPWQLRKPKYKNTAYYFDLLERAVRRGFFLGETGLDRLHPNTDLQTEYFRHHYRLAQTYNRPLTFHSVHSDDAVLSVLTPPYPKMIYHSFVGLPQTADLFLKKNVYLSFSLRSLKSPATAEAVRECPPQRFLIESDSIEEEPAAVLNEILVKAADIRRVSPENLLRCVHDNMNEIIRAD